jgi:two-component SAPR family response regulator
MTARERLRSKFLRAVGFLGRSLERDGQWTEAIACYRRGLEVDDLAEGFYQRLMLCHGRLGQIAEAVGVYDRCRKTLTAVLGILPSPETETIRRSLR